MARQALETGAAALHRLSCDCLHLLPQNPQHCTSAAVVRLRPSILLLLRRQMPGYALHGAIFQVAGLFDQMVFEEFIVIARAGVAQSSQNTAAAAKLAAHAARVPQTKACGPNPQLVGGES